jgi:type II secretory pathway pseudopilin PulG
MSIIGILAGVIMVGMGSSRKKARVTSALKTADSVLAEAAECYLKNGDFHQWTNINTGGGLICVGGSGVWPELAKKCNYADFETAGDFKFNIVCNLTSNGSDTIKCDVANASCKKL